METSSIITFLDVLYIQVCWSSPDAILYLLLSRKGIRYLENVNNIQASLRSKFVFFYFLPTRPNI